MATEMRLCCRCGRFFRTPNPYDEFCPSPRPCYWDDKAEKELAERRRRENLRALAEWR